LGQFELFVYHHASRGNLMANWKLAWFNWCRNAERIDWSEKVKYRKLILAAPKTYSYVREAQGWISSGMDRDWTQDDIDAIKRQMAKMDSESPNRDILQRYAVHGQKQLEAG